MLPVPSVAEGDDPEPVSMAKPWPVMPDESVSGVQAILDALPIDVAVQDEGGDVVYASSGAADHLIVPPEQVREWLPTAPLLSRFECEGGLDSGSARGIEFRTTRERVRIESKNYLVSTSLDLTVQKRREDELSRRAYFDDLTGLPNRRLLEEHVNARALAAATGEKFALVFLDLDHFKQINDFYGHAVGDGLLVELTKRISRCIRDTDMLSRISGDEFLLLLNPLGSEDEATVILDDLFEHIRRPVFVDGYEIFASASAA